MPGEVKFSGTVALAGFMGCGKSTAGRELARELSCSFADLDECIVRRCCRTIPEIFAAEGEAGFRKIEMEVLQEVLQERPGVLSLGGGTLTSERCSEIIKSSTICIYLKAEVDTLVGNLMRTDVADRPMLNGACSQEHLARRIRELMSQREAAYAGAARFVIRADGRNAAQVAEAIRDRLAAEGLI